MKTYTYDVEVRFRDTDNLGHINNAVYLTYVESCRTHFCDEVLGFPVFSTGSKIPIILARAEIDFLAQGYLHHKIKVKSNISHVGTKSFRQDYEVTAGDEVLARSSAVLVWFDFAANASVKIPDDVRQKLNEYLRPTK